jgi:DNA (cytosine-5)-methyltransferase 1
MRSPREGLLVSQSGNLIIAEPYFAHSLHWHQKLQSPSFMDKTFLEFFSGIGLMRVGLKKTGWKCVFANDNDLNKTTIYNANFGKECLDTRDIRRLDRRDVPNATLATASFPCQDLSEAGPRNGINGSRSAVFWDFIRIIKAMQRRPPLILLENVRGFLTSSGGRNLVAAVEALNDLRYRCDVLLIDAKYFLPQSRPRIFVVGLEENVAEDFPSSANADMQEHPFRRSIQQLVNDNGRLRWFFLPLPRIKRKAKRIDSILDAPGSVPPSYWFSRKETQRHLSMMPTMHRKKIETLQKEPKETALTMFRRMRSGQQKAELRFDGIAGCLRALRGGSSKQFVVILDKDAVKMRRLTVKEMARLMGIPPGFWLPSDYLQVGRALGDAVAVPVVEWVGENVLEPIYQQLTARHLVAE